MPFTLPLGAAFRFLDSLNQTNNPTISKTRAAPPAEPPIIAPFLELDELSARKTECLISIQDWT
jgi:hypothetical protein